MSQTAAPRHGMFAALVNASRLRNPLLQKVDVLLLQLVHDRQAPTPRFLALLFCELKLFFEEPPLPVHVVFLLLQLQEGGGVIFAESLEDLLRRSVAERSSIAERAAR